MIDFSTLAARLDTQVFLRLTDAAAIDDRPVRAIFTAPWLQPRLGSMQTGVLAPTLVIRDADLGDADRGSTAAHLGRNYTVVDIEPDSTGLTTLILREVLP